jgi:DNA-binding MarR family transcriptional regulator
MRAADVDTPFIGGSGVSFLSEPSDDSAMEAARSLIDMRRLRGNLFGHSFFSDPAWDLLLQLFVHTTSKDPLSLSTLSCESRVPHTSMTRWVAKLRDAGLVSTSEDPADGRRVFVSISTRGKSRMRQLLAGHRPERRECDENHAEPRLCMDEPRSGGPKSAVRVEA